MSRLFFAFFVTFMAFAGNNSSLLSFQENLSLGPASGKETQDWAGHRVSFVVDQKGNIYVLDTGNFRILKFDKTGAFVVQAGRQGDGPQEFQAPSNLSLLEDGTVVLFESRIGVHVFTYYDANLKWKDRKTLQAIEGRHVQALTYHPGGELYRGFWVSSPDEAQVLNMGIVSKDHKVLEQLVKLPMAPVDLSKGEENPGVWSDWLAGWLAIVPKGQGLVAFAENGSIYAGVTQKYHLQKYDAHLKKLAVLNGPTKPGFQSDEDILKIGQLLREDITAAMPGPFQSLITDKVVRDAIRKANYTNARQAMYELLPMGDQLVVVSQFDLKTGAMRGDLFDAKGSLLGSTDLPPADTYFFSSYYNNFAKLQFRNGQAYALVSEDDAYVLKRYTVTQKKP